MFIRLSLPLVGLLLLSGPLAGKPAPPRGQDVPVMTGYYSDTQEAPAPLLIVGLPAPFTIPSGAVLPARYDAGTATVTIWLAQAPTAPDYPLLAVHASCRRAERLTYDLAFPRGALALGSPGVTLTARYDPALQTLTVPLPR